MANNKVLNKYHTNQLAEFLEYISLRAFSSPSENMSDKELASIPEGQQPIMNVVAPMVGRAIDNVAKELKLKPHLRRDELDEMMGKAFSAEVTGFIENPKNEKRIISVSKAIKEQYLQSGQTEMYNGVMEDEAATLEEFPDASISVLAGVALMHEAMRSYYGSFRDDISEQFDTVAKEQGRAESRGKGGSSYKARKKKSR